MTEIEKKATRYDALCELTLMSEDEYNAVMWLMDDDDHEDAKMPEEFAAHADELVAALAEYHAVQTKQ